MGKKALKACKYAFYFRTRDEYTAVVGLLERINNEIGQTRSFFSDRSATINCPPWNITEIRSKIPASKPGKKKYIATISVRPVELHRVSFSIPEALEKLGLEMVSNAPNKPKHTNDDLTIGFVTMRNAEHFLKVTKMLNKQYGHGNWHYRGAKKILAKLRHIDHYKDQQVFFNSKGKELAEAARKGLKVEVAVVGKVDNLDPLLFKAQLMG